jgi:DNA-binding NarL/FixJ family response regulator
VVALTIHNSEEMRAAMRAAGASGYLTKSADASEVCKAIREAAARGS